MRHTAMGKQLQTKTSSEQRRASILCQTCFLCDMCMSVQRIYKSVSDMYMYASLGTINVSPRTIHVSLRQTHVSHVHSNISLGHTNFFLIKIFVCVQHIHVSRGHKKISLRHMHVFPGTIPRNRRGHTSQDTQRMHQVRSQRSHSSVIAQSQLQSQHSHSWVFRIKLEKEANPSTSML